jgi:hypothetical protein
MPDMQILGAEKRAIQLAAAARRFREEIDYALGLAIGGPPMTDFTALYATFSIPRVAEALAHIRLALETIEQHAPHEMAIDARERLRSDLLYYEETTRVPR